VSRNARTESLVFYGVETMKKLFFVWIGMLEESFEYVCQKDELIFLRKRK
jgi:hypothetical protein